MLVTDFFISIPKTVSINVALFYSKQDDLYRNMYTIMGSIIIITEYNKIKYYFYINMSIKAIKYFVSNIILLHHWYVLCNDL